MLRIDYDVTPREQVDENGGRCAESRESVCAFTIGHRVYPE